MAKTIKSTIITFLLLAIIIDISNSVNNYFSYSYHNGQNIDIDNDDDGYNHHDEYDDMISSWIDYYCYLDLNRNVASTNAPTPFPVIFSVSLSVDLYFR